MGEEKSLLRRVQKFEEDTTNAHYTLRSVLEELADERERSQELEDSAARDPLTDLYNRKELFQRIKQEISKSLRDSNLSLILYDIDDFKPYNDKYGHPIGDRVLIEVSNLSKGVFRDIDITARYGGEEFVILLPGAGRLIAKERSTQLRDLARELSIPIGEGQVIDDVTISVGGVSLEDVPEVRMLYGERGQKVIESYLKYRDNSKSLEKAIVEYKREVEFLGRKIAFSTEEIKTQLANIIHFGDEMSGDAWEEDLLLDHEFRKSLAAYIFIERADQAMYQAKRDGKDQVHVYNPQKQYQKAPDKK